MKDIKRYFLGTDAEIGVGTDRPDETCYSDNVPIITFQSSSDYVMLEIITGDDNIGRRILMTPKQGKRVSKYLKKCVKKLKR